jgi:hypothetical protein
MNCQRNFNSILPTQLSHKFSYIVAILIHNHFESPNTFYKAFIVFWYLEIKSGIQVGRYSISLKDISVIAFIVHNYLVFENVFKR